MAKPKKKPPTKKKPQKPKKPTAKSPKIQPIEAVISEQIAQTSDDITQVDIPRSKATLHRSTSRKKYWAVGGLVVVAVGAIFFWTVLRSHSPVPKAVNSAVSFSVYYPDQAKLPNGYVFDEHSFKNPVKNGVTYTVSYGSGKSIVFSVQPKPSDSELQSFASNYIPLKLDFQTPLGQAALGAYNGQTLVSMPILDGPWVIATAPQDINQDQLKQVVRALKKP